MRVLVDTVACHVVTVCKICKSTGSHTIIQRKTLFVTKSDIFFKSIELLNFPLVKFQSLSCKCGLEQFPKHGSVIPRIIKLALMQI